MKTEKGKLTDLPDLREQKTLIPTKKKEPHLSGVSFPGQTVIFHGQRILKIFQNKDGTFGHETSKFPFNSPINPFLLVYPLLDIFLLILFLISQQRAAQENFVVLYTFDNASLGMAVEGILSSIGLMIPLVVVWCLIRPYFQPCGIMTGFTCNIFVVFIMSRNDFFRILKRFMA